MSSSPDVVVLALWPWASEEHINHYLRDYSLLYPSAEIDLLFSLKTPGSYTQNPPGRNIQKCILEHDTTQFPGEHQSVLLHIFGEAAARRACWMIRSYHAQCGKPLNIGSIIFDVAPSCQRGRPSTDLFQNSKQLLLSVYYEVSRLWIQWSHPSKGWWAGSEDTHGTRAVLHDGRLVPSSARRCYVHSEGDAVILWSEAPLEDDEWQRHEYRIQRKTVDDRRWNLQRERYWQSIADAWDCAQRSD